MTTSLRLALISACLFAAAASARAENSSLENLAAEQAARFDLTGARVAAPAAVAADGSTWGAAGIASLTFKPADGTAPAAARKCDQSRPPEPGKGALLGISYAEAPAMAMPSIFGYFGIPLMIALGIALLPVALTLGAGIGAIYGCVDPEGTSKAFNKAIAPMMTGYNVG